MGQTPDEIRRDIEATRERMGETVGAIGYKTDVPSRAKESVANTKDSIVGSVVGAKDRVVESIVGTKESVGGTMSDARGSVASSFSSAGESISGTAGSVRSTVSDATPSAQDVRQGAQRTVGMAQENPLGLAIGAVALGFVAGLVIPSTRKEHQTLGPIADEVKGKVREAGEEALEHGKQVAGEAAETARRVASEAASSAQQAASEGAEQLKSSAQEHGQQAASSVQEKAQDLSGTVAPSVGSTGSSESGASTSEWPAPGAGAPIEGSGGQTPPTGYEGDGIESPRTTW